MIKSALLIMLFGMLGIFIVMGLIILTVTLFNYFGNKETKKESVSEEN